MKGTDFNLATSILFVVSSVLRRMRGVLKLTPEIGIPSDAIAIEPYNHSCEAIAILGHRYDGLVLYSHQTQPSDTSLTVSRGTISAAQAGLHSFGGLIACRFFLGFAGTSHTWIFLIHPCIDVPLFAEAPFFPGGVFLMSSWYTREELTRRIAWFYSGSSLANAFGGLLGAGVLRNLHMKHGISGWYREVPRWNFQRLTDLFS